MRDATWPARRGTALTTVPRRAAGYAEMHIGNMRRQRCVAAAYCFLSSGLHLIASTLALRLPLLSSIIRGAPRVSQGLFPRGARKAPLCSCHVAACDALAAAIRLRRAADARARGRRTPSPRARATVDRSPWSRRRPRGHTKLPLPHHRRQRCRTYPRVPAPPVRGVGLWSPWSWPRAGRFAGGGGCWRATTLPRAEEPPRVGSTARHMC